MIDSDGYRPNVGIILSSSAGQLLWARRIGQDAWQFPQGGIGANESVRDALFRELNEELGLQPGEVDILGSTRGWLRYHLPKHLIRQDSVPVCVGQKQRWFLLRLLEDDARVRLDGTDSPEFDHWRWVDYWFPLRQVVFFKRHVYRQALMEFEPLLFPCASRAGLRRQGRKSEDAAAAKLPCVARRRRGPRGFRR